MKILKRIFGVFFMFSLVFSLGLVYAEGGVVHINAPDTFSKGRYYTVKRLEKGKLYIEEKNRDTLEKTARSFVEKISRSEYVIYDASDSPMGFTHIIRAVDPNNYIVGLHYPEDEITPILEITRESYLSPWHIKPCNTLGRICLPSPEVYIEAAQKGVNLIKSAVSVPSIAAGDVYNSVTASDGDLNEFRDVMDIISFFAAFLLK